jgi:hypothetical protein
MAHKTTRQLITEIVLRGVATALPKADPRSVEDMAEPLITIIEELIVGIKPVANIATTSYRTFCIMNAIIDEIEKEIPLVADRIEVSGPVTRTQRKEFHATATVDGDRKGEAKKLDA